MLKCDPRAFAQCPEHKYCGSCAIDATFIEGSECDKFNQAVLSKPTTNADRIRAMSDEELATDLLDMFEEICEDGLPCKEWMMEWLKQPVED